MGLIKIMPGLNMKDGRVFKGGTTGTGLDAVEWARRCEALGARELLLTSVDAD